MNDRSAPPARVGNWLAAAGVDVDVLELCNGAQVPTKLPAEYDGLMPLGGGMSAMDDHLADWLKPERELLAEAVAAGYPVLGLCLGGQLLAAATGGDVWPGGVPEVGICPIELSEAAASDPLFATLSPDPVVPQFHRDGIFTAPPDSVVLASSPQYPVQAFRIGSSAWGLQFHPEIDGETIGPWLVDEADIVRAAQADPVALRAEVTQAEALVAQIWRPFAVAFAEVVKQHAASRG